MYPNKREKVVQVAYPLVSIHRFDRYLGQKFSKWHVYHIYFYIVLLSIFCCTGWYKTIFPSMDFIVQYTLKLFYILRLVYCLSYVWKNITQWSIRINCLSNYIKPVGIFLKFSDRANFACISGSVLNGHYSYDSWLLIFPRDEPKRL